MNASEIITILILLTVVIALLYQSVIQIIDEEYQGILSGLLIILWAIAIICSMYYLIIGG